MAIKLNAISEVKTFICDADYPPNMLSAISEVKTFICDADYRPNMSEASEPDSPFQIYVPDFPEVENVLTIDTVDNVPGVYVPVIEDNVRDGIDFGANSLEEGNLVSPAESDVLAPVGYGSNGTEFEGEYVPSVPDYPFPSNVLEDDTVNGVPGTFVAPSQNDVEDGVLFGSEEEFEGNFEAPAEANVLFGIGYGSNGTEFEGTYIPTESEAPGLAEFEVTDASDGTISIELIAIPDDEDLLVIRVYGRIRKAQDVDEWTKWTDISNPIVGSAYTKSGLVNGTEFELHCVSVDTSGNESPPGIIARVTPAASSGNIVFTGDLNKSVYLLKDLLSNCATFQTWCGVDNAAAAKAFIHEYALDGDEIDRPFALIERTGREDSIIAGGARNYRMGRGSLELTFEADISEAYRDSHINARTEFDNILGAIITEMWELAGKGTHLSIHNVAQVEGPTRNAKNERKTGTNSVDFYYREKWAVEWGP